MGNYISCTLAPAMMKNAKAARVIFPTGEVKQFKETVKAAELMLECPNFFCANSTSLHIGRRFSALSADEELEFGNVYIMFPMRRIHSFVTAGDMGLLFVAANSAAKRISGGKVRVLPEAYVRKSSQGVALDKARSNNTSELNSSSPRLSLDGISEFEHKLLICRSRKPLLETINEEPTGSRLMEILSVQNQVQGEAIDSWEVGAYVYQPVLAAMTYKHRGRSNVVFQYRIA